MGHARHEGNELSAFDLIASRYDDMDDKADSEPSQFLGKLIKKDVIRNMRTLFELRGAAYWLASEGRYLPRSREAIIDVCRKEVNRLFPELIGE